VLAARFCLTPDAPICHPRCVHIADAPVAVDTPTLIGLFDLDAELAQAVTVLYETPKLRIPGARPAPGSAVAERLAELGILRSADAAEPLPLTDAIEAGWRHREREAEEFRAVIGDRAEAQLAYLMTVADDMGADVGEVRSSNDDAWYLGIIRTAKHVISAVPPVPPPAVRRTGSWRREEIVPTEMFAPGAILTTTYDPSRLRQFRDLACSAAEARELPGSTINQRDAPLRVSTVDADMTLLPAQPPGASGITVVRSERFATFAREFIMRDARPVRIDPTPELDSLAAAVLRLLAGGAKDDTIARKLAVSDRTVRRVIADLMSQLSAESRFQLGLRAARTGLI
jgi:DNA-binding CsgD family transcriptional regulator